MAKNDSINTDQFFFRLFLVCILIYAFSLVSFGQATQAFTPDSLHAQTRGQASGYRLADLRFPDKENKDNFSNFIEDFTGYHLQLAKNLNVLAGNGPGFLSASGGRYMRNPYSLDSAGGALNSGYYPRANLRLQGVRLEMQHFTLGASYNYGLNNLWRSGGDFGQGSKNAGLSIHAGLSF